MPLTITVKLVAVDVQPAAFFTVIVPVYVPAAVLAGIAILIGLPVKAAFETGKKLFVGLELQVMLYEFGEFAGAL